MGQLPLNSPAFERKRAGTAGEREDEKIQAIGLRLVSTGELARQFQADFQAADYGFKHFAALDDPLLRAFASSRVRSAIGGVGRNLLEARLHEHHVYRVVGPNGRPWPGHETSVVDDLELDEMQMHLAGFFRSIGSTFDCLAAVLIGVARIPASLQFADVGNILKLNLAKAAERIRTRPTVQDQLWTEVRNLVRSANDGPPEDWLDWTLQMRNALVHRGRGLFNLSARQTPARTPIYVEGAHPPQALVRYDPHLRTRPWLTDLQNLLGHGEPLGHWLSEPAQSTISRIRVATNELCEAAAAWALRHWRDDQSQMSLSVDSGSWQERPFSCDFRGFDPALTSTADTVVVSPDEHEFISLVQRLRAEGHQL
jgi:hypothetical protein